LADSQYVGRSDADCLVQKLSSVYAADPDLSDPRETIATTAARKAKKSCGRNWRCTKTKPGGTNLELPIQHLSQFPDIWRVLQKARWIYRMNKQVV
jgi:hypothetical protein